MMGERGAADEHHKEGERTQLPERFLASAREGVGESSRRCCGRRVGHWGRAMIAVIYLGYIHCGNPFQAP